MILLRQILVCVALVALTGALLQISFVLQDGRALVHTSARTGQGLDLLRVTLQAQLTGKYGLLSELTAAARESRKTIDVLQKTSLTERVKFAAFSEASIQAVRDLDTVAINASAAVRTLQGAAAELGGTAAALGEDARAARPVIERAGVLLGTVNEGSGRVLERVNAAVGDVQDRIRAVEPIEQQLASTAKHIDGAAAITEETLGYIRDGFKPRKKSFWLRLADAATSGAVSMMLHLWPQRVEIVH